MRGEFFISKKGEEAVLVSLDCTPSGGLLWDFPLIERLIEAGKKICFKLSFGLYAEETNFHDETLFAARRFAMQYLQEKILTPYESHVEALLFYTGSFDFTPSLKKFSNLQLLYRDRLQDFEKKDTPHQRRLFSLELLMTYLHRLSASLASEIFSFVLLDMGQEISLSEKAELLSKESFPYIYPGCQDFPSLFEGVGLRNNLGLYGYVGPREGYQKPEEPTVGIALPKSMKYALVEELIKNLQEEGTPFRIFPDHLVAESWGQLSKIYIFPEETHPEAIRHLQGFIAAEGIVEEFRGRGTRTPDLLVPNQTR